MEGSRLLVRAGARRVEDPIRIPKWFHEAIEASRHVAGRDVFFVIGCQKSGTTWVERLLNSHPSVCCMGEGHFSDVAGPMLEQVAKLYNDDARTNYRLSAEGLFAVARLFADQVLSQYLATCEHPEEIRAIGDRTPEGAIGVPALDALYPGARFIHIIRDGRDGAVSGWAQLRRQGDVGKFSGFAEYALYFAKSHWVPYITRARQSATRLAGRYLELRYETLQAEPAVQTRRMLAFLGVDASDEIVGACVDAASFRVLSGGRNPGEEDPKSHYRKGIVGDWQNHFDDETHSRFLQEAGNLLREIGYADLEQMAGVT